MKYCTLLFLSLFIHLPNASHSQATKGNKWLKHIVGFSLNQSAEAGRFNERIWTRRQGNDEIISLAGKCIPKANVRQMEEGPNGNWVKFRFEVPLTILEISHGDFPICEAGQLLAGSIKVEVDPEESSQLSISCSIDLQEMEEMSPEGKRFAQSTASKFRDIFHANLRTNLTKITLSIAASYETLQN